MRWSFALVAFTSVLFASDGHDSRDNEMHRPWDGSHARSQSEGSGAPEIIPHSMRAHGAAPTAGPPDPVPLRIASRGGPVVIAKRTRDRVRELEPENWHRHSSRAADDPGLPVRLKPLELLRHERGVFWEELPS